MEPYSRVQKEALHSSLRCFLKFYDGRRDVFREGTACWRQAGSAEPRPPADALAVALLGLLGGGLGAVVGGVSGGLWGVFGSVGAATCLRICGHVNAVGASVGFLGGSSGGLVGGAICGSIGCAVELALVASDKQVNGVASGVLWSSLGFATGGAIGSIFGGSIGAVGGAVGGGFGALHAQAFASYMARRILKPRSEEKGSVAADANTKMLQTSVQNLFKCLRPLREELRNIPLVLVDGTPLAIWTQAYKTMAAINSLQEALDKRTRCWTEAARRSDEVLEELEKMKVEAEKTLKMLV